MIKKIMYGVVILLILILVSVFIISPIINKFNEEDKFNNLDKEISFNSDGTIIEIKSYYYLSEPWNVSTANLVN